MIEVKVLCPCGSKFKFDVEPVNNLVPSPVTCPSCGQDATELANADLHQKLHLLPATPPAEALPATAGSELPKVRLRLSAHAEPAGAPAAPAPVTTTPTPAALPAGRTISPAVARHLEPSGDRALWLGIAGAVAGGFVGMMIWFLIIKWTHYEIGWIAWGVGVLAGYGARVTGSQPTPALGFITALCALAAIVGGQYLATRSIVTEILDKGINEAYTERLNYAREGVNAKSDDEIRAFLIRHGEADDDDKKAGRLQVVRPEQIKEFRDTEQTTLQEFIAGKPSREEFGRNLRRIQETAGFRMLMFKESFGLMTLLWLFLGMGSAFKIASGASGD